MTDQDIINLFQRDRQKAFSVVVKTHQEQIYWYVRKTVVSHDDTNDILQNTFRKAWTAFAKFEGRSAISTWLHKIASNEMYTHLRKHNRTEYNTETVQQLLTAEKSAGYFSGDDAQEKLLTAIAELPQRQKEVFNLRYFQEKTYDEIVEILGGTTGSHKASYHHAKEKIKKILTNSLNPI